MKLHSIPEGTTHWEYTMQEAINAFERGEWDKGLLNLSHASFIAIRKREVVSEQRALELVRKVAGFGYSPESAA